MYLETLHFRELKGGWKKAEHLGFEQIWCNSVFAALLWVVENQNIFENVLVTWNVKTIDFYKKVFLFLQGTFYKTTGYFEL